MWTCPDCGKKFRNKNQWHSCCRFSLDDHLINKSESIRSTIFLLIREIKNFGPIQINPVKSSIQVKAGATFLSVRVKRDHVELEFQLSRQKEDFPVHRVVRISGKRYLHFVYIQEPEDVDETLLGWLKESYGLIANG